MADTPREALQKRLEITRKAASDFDEALHLARAREGTRNPRLQRAIVEGLESIAEELHEEERELAASLEQLDHNSTS